MYTYLDYNQTEYCTLIGNKQQLLCHLAESSIVCVLLAWQGRGAGAVAGRKAMMWLFTEGGFVVIINVSIIGFP